MDSQTKTNLIENLQNRVIKRKAMFIPMLCISAFGLVGYAAVDKESPVIESNKVEVLYGTTLDKNIFTISDNRDSLEALDVVIDEKNYDPYHLGVYNVDVAVTDLFSNTSMKTVQVEVVDRTAPKMSAVGKTGGYAVNVEVNGSSDVSKYIHATDNVDGDVTPFIESNKPLNVKKLGSQTLTLSVSDNAGNTATQAFDFYVSDTIAPVIKYKKGKKVTVDYGSKFNYRDYVEITDNFDNKVTSVKVEGSVNTKKIGSYQIAIVAMDSNGNKSKGSLDVVVKDVSAPKINLSKSSVDIDVGDSFNAKKYLRSAVDNKDGNVTSKVKVSGSVNTKKAGTYTVTYSVSDEAGNKASKSMKVYVVVSGTGAAQSALSRVGCAYVSGATGPRRFDCSGLTQWSYRQNGIYIPRTAAAQYSATSRVSRSNLRAGDLVFFSGTTGRGGITHVGIYIGGGRFVHAGTERTGVRTDNLNSSYWVRHYAGAGRK